MSKLKILASGVIPGGLMCKENCQEPCCLNPLIQTKFLQTPPKEHTEGVYAGFSFQADEVFKEEK